MEEEKEYFTWEPYEGAEHKEKIIINDFSMDPISKYTDRTNLRGVSVKGLFKIAIEGDSNEANNTEKYSINFKGRMKIILDLSEEEKIRLDRRRKSSSDSLRRSRGKIYKKNIETYFPREELGNQLDEILKDNNSRIEIRKMKDLIHTILSEKKPLTPKESNLIYYSRLIAREIKNLMLERHYVKEGDKYVKMQE
jgi:hypothetical protein